MDPLLGLGAGMMAAGTLANLYGTYQRDKATRGALKDYQGAVGAKADADRRALEQEQGILSGLGADRQRGIGRYITDLSYAQFPGTDEGFAENNTGILNNVKELTQGNDGVYAYTGAPRTQAEGGQAKETGGRNRRIAEALLADHELRQIQEREQNSGHRMALADLMRAAQGGDITKRFQLAKALRELDWQRKTAAMQGQLDEAGRKGQWLNLLGGLGTQAGGLAMMAGLSGAGGAEGAGVAPELGPSGGPEAFASSSQYAAAGGGPSVYNF